MASSRVVLARECCANLALNLLIESENVCLFLWWGGKHTVSRGQEGLQGCALMKFTFLLCSLCYSVETQRFHELVQNF